MKLFAWRWLAGSSLLLAALVARSEMRPQYGGTLHIATRKTFVSLDCSQIDSLTQANITRLIFETLITLDNRGGPQPLLAVSWQASRDNRRWRVQLRSGVRFQDGAALTPEIAAASLQAANPSWHVSADKDAIVIDRESTEPELLAELALPHNAIADRGNTGASSGTGPFRVTAWQPGKRLSLVANDDYWQGRPFLDSVEVEMNKNYRGQLTQFQSGRADLIEVAPEQEQPFPIDRQNVRSSLPIELLALNFAQDAQPSGEKLLRKALALSIDRASIGNVLLQGAAQPAGSLLPNWMTGYGFVFPSQTDLAQARKIRDQVPSIPTWTLSYDAEDPLLRLVAERVALNAKDAGLSVHLVSGASSDLRLVRVSLQSPDSWSALGHLATYAGLSLPQAQNESVESLYAAEQSLLATERIIPLFHFPVAYAVSPRLQNWCLQEDGSLNLADAWLENRP
jgi:peptide/nickel transport system substrate-binding protein